MNSSAKNGKTTAAGGTIKIGVLDLVQIVTMTIGAHIVLGGTMGSITVGRD